MYTDIFEGGKEFECFLQLIQSRAIDLRFISVYVQEFSDLQRLKFLT